MWASKQLRSGSSTSTIAAANLMYASRWLSFYWIGFSSAFWSRVGNSKQTSKSCLMATQSYYQPTGLLHPSAPSSGSHYSARTCTRDGHPQSMCSSPSLLWPANTFSRRIHSPSPPLLQEANINTLGSISLSELWTVSLVISSSTPKHIPRSVSDLTVRTVQATLSTCCARAMLPLLWWVDRVLRLLTRCCGLCYSRRPQVGAAAVATAMLKRQLQLSQRAAGWH